MLTNDHFDCAPVQIPVYHKWEPHVTTESEPVAAEDPFENSPFKVEWNGGRWCLCCGEWTVEKDGVPVAMPIEKRTGHMNTYGIYHRWHFVDHWGEQWESYEDGLHETEWFDANPWAADVCFSEEERHLLFAQIHEEDWRPHSCGGCI